ncbi:MAG: CBS domain-containing protein [Methanomassiliicoccales archaeon]
MKAAKTIKNMKIEEIMTRNVIAVEEETSIKELKQLFDKYDYNSFPVVHDGYLVGIVTKLDLLKTFSPGFSSSKTNFLKLFAEKVGEIMRRGVITLHPRDDLRKAIDFMVEFKLRSLPVVDDDGKLVGIVSRKDLMNHLAVVQE